MYYVNTSVLYAAVKPVIAFLFASGLGINSDCAPSDVDVLPVLSLGIVGVNIGNGDLPGPSDTPGIIACMGCMRLGNIPVMYPGLIAEFNGIGIPDSGCIPCPIGIIACIACISWGACILKLPGLNVPGW